MYQIDWASSKRWSLEKGRVSAGSSRLHTADISGVTLIQWQEHCVECAVPLCYETCYLYVARANNRCARFDYGIMRNRDVSGLERYGADIRFRRSGKLEAELTGRIVSPRVHTLLERIGMTERVRPGLRQAKALWNFALKQVYQTRTTDGLTAFSTFHERLAAKAHWDGTMELMCHPGNALYEEETQLVAGDWQNTIAPYARLISYRDV